MDGDEEHHSDDSCLLHEFTSPTCSRGVSPRYRAPSRRRSYSNPCCSTSSSNCQASAHPIFTSSRPLTRLGNLEDLSSRLDCMRREMRSNRSTTPRSHQVDDDPLTCCDSVRWDVKLLRALRSDPNSMPEKPTHGSRFTIRTRQAGRADVGFTPRKGDLIIHHERKPGRRVLEFYDPVCQRLHDGDILVRFKIDSYACEGIVNVKGTGYLYHRGFWVYLGKDSDQITRSCSAW